MTRKKGLSSRQMSSLYKQLRRKGYAKRSSFSTVGEAKRLSIGKFNSKWKHGKFGKYKFLDFDGDGKVNKFDCKPFNKYEQDKYNYEQLVSAQNKANKDNIKSGKKKAKEELKATPISTSELDHAETMSNIKSSTKKGFGKLKYVTKKISSKIKSSSNKTFKDLKNKASDFTTDLKIKNIEKRLSKTKPIKDTFTAPKGKSSEPFYGAGVTLTQDQKFRARNIKRSSDAKSIPYDDIPVLRAKRDKTPVYKAPYGISSEPYYGSGVTLTQAQKFRARNIKRSSTVKSVPYDDLPILSKRKNKNNNKSSLNTRNSDTYFTPYY